MCGIVGAVAQRDVSPILLEGLKRLEYRGYDSAGIAVLDHDTKLNRVRVSGKVNELVNELDKFPLAGGLGIAHTRWATHGVPGTKNAHPHISEDYVALVHNGIIENHEIIKKNLLEQGYSFESDTDSEVIVKLIHHYLKQSGNLLESVTRSVAQLTGAYAIGVISKSDPERLIAARQGNPLVIGVGIGENFIASDIFALLPVTQKFIFLEDGDIADIRRDSVKIYDRNQQTVNRQVSISELSPELTEKLGYRHYMLKEIMEQPNAIAETLEGRISNGRIDEQAFGMRAARVFDDVKAVQIVACGTSYHAGLAAKYWMESIAKIPCQVDVASEFRSRKVLVPDNTLFVTISQSGETADTLAALRLARELPYLSTLAICNVAESPLTRESDLVFLTHAGPEIGVASTKAFTTQLVALIMLVISLGRRHGLSEKTMSEYIDQLEGLPGKINIVLELNDKITDLAEEFGNKHHALYLGRGPMLPVAMEGALKLKEISYIHAEAYPAGELKHGPLALVDNDMPVIAVAPKNELLEKLKTNLSEVSVRGGMLYVFTDSETDVEPADNLKILPVIKVDELIAPIIYTVPLQLFAYHIAVIKGADIDQPRNLAKSITVE